jgi:hypothetical protein
MSHCDIDDIKQTSWLFIKFSLSLSFSLFRSLPCCLFMRKKKKIISFHLSVSLNVDSNAILSTAINQMSGSSYIQPNNNNNNSRGSSGELFSRYMCVFVQCNLLSTLREKKIQNVNPLVAPNINFS